MSASVCPEGPSGCRAISSPGSVMAVQDPGSPPHLNPASEMLAADQRSARSRALARMERDVTPPPSLLEPDRGLAGPFALGELLLQLLGRGAQVGRVVARLVGRDAGPVARLGGGAGRPVGAADRPEALLRLGVQAALEGDLGEAELQLRQEIVHRQEALDPVLLRASGIQQENG